MSHVFHTIGSFLGHNIGPIIGGTLGTLVAPGIGTAIGAGLGSEGQGLAKGKPFGQATLGALETGGEVYGGSELLGAGASAAGLTGAGAGAGAGTSGAASSGILSGLGSDISSGLQSVGLGGIGPALSGIGTDISTGASNLGTSLGLTGPGGLTSEISSGWNQLTGGASNLLGGGTAGTQAVGGGAAVSNPALASTLESVPGNIASTAANAPTISQGGGGILSALTGGGGAGGKGLFGGSPLEAMFAAAPIALKVLQGNQPYKGETQLQQSAAQLGQQGTHSRVTSKPERSHLARKRRSTKRLQRLRRQSEASTLQWVGLVRRQSNRISRTRSCKGSRRQIRWRKAYCLLEFKNLKCRMNCTKTS